MFRSLDWLPVRSALVCVCIHPIRVLCLAVRVMNNCATDASLVLLPVITLSGAHPMYHICTQLMQYFCANNFQCFSVDNQLYSIETIPDIESHFSFVWPQCVSAIGCRRLSVAVSGLQWPSARPVLSATNSEHIFLIIKRLHFSSN